MYIEVGDLLDEKLTLTVITQTAEDRAFSIKITQLNDSLAPRDCLQYFTEPEGIIKTFNYDDISKIVNFRNPSYFVSYFHYCSLLTHTLLIYCHNLSLYFVIKLAKYN